MPELQKQPFSRSDYIAGFGAILGMVAALGDLDWITRIILILTSMGLVIYGAWHHTGHPFKRAGVAAFVIAAIGFITWRPVWDDFIKKHPTLANDYITSVAERLPEIKNWTTLNIIFAVLLMGLLVLLAYRFSSSKIRTRETQQAPAQPSGGRMDINATILPPAHYDKAQIQRLLRAIDALYSPLSEMEQVLLTGTWIAGSTEEIIKSRGARHFLAEMEQLRQKLLDPLTRFETALREFSLYTEICRIVEDAELRKNAYFASRNALAAIVREIQDQQLSAAALTIFLETKRKDFVERGAEYYAWAQLKKAALSESRERYLHWRTTD